MAFQVHYLLAAALGRWAISSDNGEGAITGVLHLTSIHCVGTLVLERDKVTNI